jgi:hypothetical protein
MSATNDRYNFYLTFDCDPANFDLSLRVIGDPGLQHLEKSVPIAIDLLEEASENLQRHIKATFFIRNISTNSKGTIVSEPWKRYTNLWKKLISKGHGLGLHPHIDVPIVGEFDPNFLLATELMNRDFESLARLHEYGRVTRVGGHAYNESTSAMLRKTHVRIDSSAIPGRKLGAYDSCSNWLEVDNELKMDWTYPNLEPQGARPADCLAQLPMTTLRKLDQADYRRYVDFSFARFDDFSLLDFKSGERVKHLVAISHPSTLLENYYMEHPTLKFGTQNWMSNLMGFFNKFQGNSGQIDFQLLRNIR